MRSKICRWKGENVSTTEVEGILQSEKNVINITVYGVEVIFSVSKIFRYPEWKAEQGWQRWSLRRASISKTFFPWLRSV